MSVGGTDSGFDVISSSVNTSYLIFGVDGSYEPTPPLFNDYGGATPTSGYCADGDLWFEALCTANSTAGTTMTFAPVQGKNSFQIFGGRKLDQPGDVFWSPGFLDVVPEPVSISLFALSGLVFLRRRKM